MDPKYEHASKLIAEKIDDLVKISVDRQYKLQSKYWTSFHQAGYKKGLRDVGYHFSYLVESLAAEDPNLYLDYIAWAKVLFAGLNFPPDVLLTTLDCMDYAIHKKLPKDVASLAGDYLKLAKMHLIETSDSIQSFITPASPHYGLATDYLSNLLKGDRHEASNIIMSAVEDGTGIKVIYMQVFQPSQHEIGRLWQMNLISVAQEHFCTVATQMVMSQLYPYIFNSTKNGYRLVATSVGDELHEIGVRMVADFLEMDGWDTYYLGANTPNESVLHTIQDLEPDVVAISATITYNVGKVAKLIDLIRSTTHHTSVKIMVGGYPFNVSHDLWHQIGADGYASDARQAAAMAGSLVGEMR